jgi:hypothetical protein
MSPSREDAARDSAPPLDVPIAGDDFPRDIPAPMAGTVPASVPGEVWLRSGPASTGQPAAQVPRVSGLARFVWIGDDPLHLTPSVTLEREVSAGVFAPVARRSGRPVNDAEMIVSYTPQPLERVTGMPQTHYWAVEWQPVPWLGARDEGGASLDTLDLRAALPLGRYRFHVAGADFQITSAPFEVVAAPLEVTVTPNEGAGTVTVTVALNAPQGYRLMDLELPSNRAVPLRGAALSIVLTHATGPNTELALVTDAQGQVTFTAPAEPIVSTTVTDPHGNQGTL